MKNKKIYISIGIIVPILILAIYLFLIQKDKNIETNTTTGTIINTDGKQNLDNDNSSFDNNQENQEKQDEIISEVIPDIDKNIFKTEIEDEYYNYKGVLEDVTGGKIITGIDTNNNAKGFAMSKFENNKYKLDVKFENLPEPKGSDFYEGWIVRKGLKFDVISTGKLEKIDGKYINKFESDINLLDHDFYVLTIEPDDGNPKPAEHILEGTMDMVK